MTGTGTVIATSPPAAPTTRRATNTASTSDRQHGDVRRDRADGHDQPGRRPGRPDERVADQLHGRLQRAGHRLRRRRRDAERHRRARTTAVVTGSGTTYNVAVSGMTGDGTVIATIAAGGATDAAGNTNTARPRPTTRSRYDTTAPTVTINQAAGQADPTNTRRSTSPSSSARPSPASPPPTSRSAARRRDDRDRHRQRHDLQRRGQRHDRRRHGHRHGRGRRRRDAAGNNNTASTSTDNTVTYDVTRADGDDQPGGRPGRPDERLADQLHGRLQRAGHRLHRRRRHA